MKDIWIEEVFGAEFHTKLRQNLTNIDADPSDMLRMLNDKLGADNVELAITNESPVSMVARLKFKLIASIQVSWNFELALVDDHEVKTFYTTVPLVMMNQHLLSVMDILIKEIETRDSLVQGISGFPRQWPVFNAERFRTRLRELPTTSSTDLMSMLSESSRLNELYAGFVAKLHPLPIIAPDPVIVNVAVDDDFVEVPVPDELTPTMKPNADHEPTPFPLTESKPTPTSESTSAPIVEPETLVKKPAPKKPKKRKLF
jgi:hypothetical protein